MDARLTRLTKALALALGSDDGLRQRIKKAIAESPYREFKLDFSRLVKDNGLGLRDGMESVADFSVSAALDSIVPLELYLPVPEHRSWPGDERLWVASLLSDDSGEPSAFNLAGDVVPLTLEAVPQMPTLSLVPAETDFSRPSEPALAPALSGGSGGTVRMTASYLTDVHEPFLNGSPEIVVHVARWAENDSTVDWISCAGDGQSGDYYFDQNDNSWSGDVAIAPDSLVESETYEVMVWEDDWDRCDGTDYLTPNAAYDEIDPLTGSVKAAIEIGVDTPSGWHEWVEYAGEKLYELWEDVTDDDFVGIAAPIPGGCFNTSTGAQEFTLRDVSGTYKGNIDLVNDFAERDKCPFEVEILGPSEAQPYDYCNWFLDFDYGVGPYDIDWSGLVSGSGSSAGATVTSSGWVHVSVTDANDEEDGDDVYVWVDGEAAQCLL